MKGRSQYAVSKPVQDVILISVGHFTFKRVKTFTYLGSTLAAGGCRTGCGSHPQSAELVGGKLEESVWSVVRQENELEDRGEGVQHSGKTSTGVGGRYMGVEEGTGRGIGGRRNENATMDVSELRSWTRSEMKE